MKDVDGFADEKQFWLNWKGGEYHRWLLTDRELQASVARLLPAWKSSTRVLDVGAGAVSVLGNQVNGIGFQLVQADILECWFQSVFGDRPRERYAVDAEMMQVNEPFDVVASVNAVDHMTNPDVALRNMSLASSSAFYLEHFTDVAVLNGWRGLHQWNFNEREGRLVLWSKDRVLDVVDCLGCAAWKVWREFRDKWEVICFAGWKHGKSP